MNSNWRALKSPPPKPGYYLVWQQTKNPNKGVYNKFKEAFFGGTDWFFPNSPQTKLEHILGWTFYPWDEIEVKNENQCS